MDPLDTWSSECSQVEIRGALRHPKNCKSQFRFQFKFGKRAMTATLQ
jgi:hypothetical protein